MANNLGIDYSLTDYYGGGGGLASYYNSTPSMPTSSGMAHSAGSAGGGASSSGIGSTSAGGIYQQQSQSQVDQQMTQDSLLFQMFEDEMNMFNNYGFINPHNDLTAYLNDFDRTFGQKIDNELNLFLGNLDWMSPPPTPPLPPPNSPSSPSSPLSPSIMTQPQQHQLIHHQQLHQHHQQQQQLQLQQQQQQQQQQQKMNHMAYQVAPQMSMIPDNQQRRQIIQPYHDQQQQQLQQQQLTQPQLQPQQHPQPQVVQPQIQQQQQINNMTHHQVAPQIEILPDNQHQLQQPIHQQQQVNHMAYNLVEPQMDIMPDNQQHQHQAPPQPQQLIQNNNRSIPVQQTVCRKKQPQPRAQKRTSCGTSLLATRPKLVKKPCKQSLVATNDSSRLTKTTTNYKLLNKSNSNNTAKILPNINRTYTTLTTNSTTTPLTAMKSIQLPTVIISSNSMVSNSASSALSKPKVPFLIPALRDHDYCKM